MSCMVSSVCVAVPGKIASMCRHARIYAGRGPGGLVCSNRCIRNVSAGTHNRQAVDDTSEAVDVDGGLRATADEEKKYRP